MSPYYSIRSKILKSIAISNLGYLNNAYQLLIKVVQLKDLPTTFQKVSEFVKKNSGDNWFSDANSFYHCDLLPGDPKNGGAINAI